MSKKIDPELDLLQIKQFQKLLKEEKELLFEIPEARQRLRLWLSDEDQLDIKKKIFSIKSLELLEQLLADPRSSSKEILKVLEGGHIWNECWQEPRLAAEKAKGKAVATWKKVYEESIRIRNEICLRYINFSGWVADRYASGYLDREELQSQAFFGLIRACECFDPERKTSFASYAKIWMRDFVMIAVRRHQVVTPGTQHYKQMARLDKICNDLRTRLGREPFPEEIAGEMGYTLEKLEDLQASQLHVTSLDKPLEGDGLEEGETLESVIGENAAAPFERMEREKISNRLAEHLKGLTEIERLVCGFRWVSHPNSELRAEPLEVMEAIQRMRVVSWNRIADAL